MPTSSASTMFAASDVEPEAFSVVNEEVSLPNGKSPTNGPMSTLTIERPSSARIFTASCRVTTCSRPSPGTWL